MKIIDISLGEPGTPGLSIWQFNTRRLGRGKDSHNGHHNGYGNDPLRMLVPDLDCDASVTPFGQAVARDGGRCFGRLFFGSINIKAVLSIAVRNKSR